VAAASKIRLGEVLVVPREGGAGAPRCARL